MIKRSRQRRSVALLAVAGLALGGAAAIADPASADASRTNDIVMLNAQPVTTYAGETPAWPPPRRPPGRRSTGRGPASRPTASTSTGSGPPCWPPPRGRRCSTNTTTRSRASPPRLTGAEAAALARRGEVAAVVPDEVRQLETSGTPTFLGLPGTGGTWSKLGGPTRAGDRVIIGVIDSGFIPENPSFGQMATTPASDSAVAAKFSGSCDPGDEAPLVTCNKKVIGAQYFDQGIGNRAIPGEFDSVRDYAGHGSHTASTAAGHDGVAAIVDGQNLGTISGMAPQARLSIYKVCWSTDLVGGNSCFSTDSVRSRSRSSRSPGRRRTAAPSTDSLWAGPFADLQRRAVRVNIDAHRPPLGGAELQAGLRALR